MGPSSKVQHIFARSVLQTMRYQRRIFVFKSERRWVKSLHSLIVQNQAAQKTAQLENIQDY